MKIRVITALFIIIFIIIPLIFGIIYGVAAINFATSSRFYQEDLPQTISELPRFIDLTIDLLKENRAQNSPETNIWLDAIERANIDLATVLTESGIGDWLEGELKHKLQTFSRMVSGEIPFQSLKINLLGLKEILGGKYIETVIIKILNNLPSCNGESYSSWENYLQNQTNGIPSCRPDEKQIPKIVDKFQKRLNSEFANDIDFARFDIEGNHFFIKGKIISFAGVLLFLLPAGILSLTALLPARNLSTYLRWVGFPTLIGAGISFLSGFLFQQLFNLSHLTNFPKKEAAFFELLFLKSLDQIFLKMIKFFFLEVQKLSLTIIIISLVLIALAEILKKTRQPA